MDWVVSPGSFFAFKKILDSGSSIGEPSASTTDKSIHPLEVYAMPAVAEELERFIHKVVAALGTSPGPIADTQRHGITFARWTEVYVEHLKRLSRHAAVE